MRRASAVWVAVLYAVLVVSFVSSSPSVDGPTVFEGTPPPEGANRTAARINRSNVTVADKDDWYVGDHPFLYQMDKVRAPNGTWVKNPNAIFPPFTVEEWRNNTMKRVPWWIRWYVTGETRELRKEMVSRRKTVIDWVVSPMDYGRSLRAQSVRQQWHEQLRHFWTEALGQKLLKNLKRNIQAILFGGMQRYIESELYIKSFRSMNSTEWMLYNNMTPEQIEDIRAQAAENVRWKFTRPYRYKIPGDLADGAQQSLPGVKLMVQFFQPYFNYTSRYYDGDKEELPPPTMPGAIAYPWPWSDRISQVRAALVGMMRVEAARNSLAKADRDASSASGSASPEIQISELRMLQEVQAGSDSSSDDFRVEDADSMDDRSSSDSSSSDDGTQFDEASKAAAIRQLEQLTKEFHFTTGIPRLNMMKNRFAPVAFPSLREFLNLSVDANGSLTVEPGERFTSAPFEPDAGHPTQPGTPHTNVRALAHSAPDFSSREGVYAAAAYFYSYTTVESGFVQAKDYSNEKPEERKMPIDDGTVLVDDLKPVEKVILLDCSVTSPCLVRSGVTVFTPKVASAVVDVFVNMSSTTAAAASAQRLKRQDWIMNIFQEAFDAESRVLDSGLLAPSTVWNSFFDRSSDILADSVLGFANGSKAMTTGGGSSLKSRAIFESLVDNSSSPLAMGYSHYTMTNHRTKYSIYKAKTVPELVPFTSEQLIYLVGFLVKLTRQMEATIEQYERTRDADPMHVAIVNATREAVYYDGRLFGVLGYGYYLPSTNSATVAYRDHKIPIPFHLIIRVLIRLQESHLVLPEESIHLAACLAMLQFDVQYYRCVEIKEEDRATPRPMQEEPPTSPLPPSETQKATHAMTPQSMEAEPVSPPPPSRGPEATQTSVKATDTPTIVPHSSPRSVSFDWP